MRREDNTKRESVRPNTRRDLFKRLTTLVGREREREREEEFECAIQTISISVVKTKQKRKIPNTIESPFLALSLPSFNTKLFRCIKRKKRRKHQKNRNVYD